MAAGAAPAGLQHSCAAGLNDVNVLLTYVLMMIARSRVSGFRMKLSARWVGG
jgi:hypothetical protein